MKLKYDFVLRKVAGENLLIPISSTEDSFHGIINLNETAVSIYQGMIDGKDKIEIVNQLTAEYNVEYDEALSDVEDFCNYLKELQILE